LQQLFAANRRLFKAYVLREQLDRLWTYKTREGVAGFLFGWLKALRWQRLPEMEKLGDTLVVPKRSARYAIELLPRGCRYRIPGSGS
jgi:transposase